MKQACSFRLVKGFVSLWYKEICQIEYASVIFCSKDRAQKEYYNIKVITKLVWIYWNTWIFFNFVLWFLYCTQLEENNREPFYGQIWPKISFIAFPNRLFSDHIDNILRLFQPSFNSGRSHCIISKYFSFWAEHPSFVNSSYISLSNA